MTAEQHYAEAKANFIAASQALHLAYDTYDPQFQLAADAVRGAKHLNFQKIINSCNQ